MPVTISDNLATQSPKFTVNQKGGQRVVLYLVGGLDPSHDPVTAASTAVDSTSGLAMPRYGSPYPYNSALGLRATVLEFEPFPRDSRTSVLARVTYTSPEVEPQPRRREGPHQRLRRPRHLRPGRQGQPAQGLLHRPLGQRLRRRRPPDGAPAATVLEIERIEPGSPLGKSAAYAGSVNSDTFQGGQPLTWMCRGVTGESLGSGQFRVNYVFEYDPATWQENYAFRDRVTRRTPSDVRPSTNNDHGIYTYTPPQQAFGALGLPQVY